MIQQLFRCGGETSGAIIETENNRTLRITVYYDNVNMTRALDWRETTTLLLRLLVWSIRRGS